MKKELKPIVDEEIMFATIKNYGVNAQITVAIEEFSELIQLLTKRLRGSLMDEQHLIEEYSDVFYMMEQLKLIFGITDDDIRKVVAEKQQRQLRRMANNG